MPLTQAVEEPGQVLEKTPTERCGSGLLFEDLKRMEISPQDICATLSEFWLSTQGVIQLSQSRVKRTDWGEGMNSQQHTPKRSQIRTNRRGRPLGECILEDWIKKAQRIDLSMLTFVNESLC